MDVGTIMVRPGSQPAPPAAPPIAEANKLGLLLLLSWSLLGALLVPAVVLSMLYLRSRIWAALAAARARPVVIWLGVDPEGDSGPGELGPSSYFLRTGNRIRGAKVSPRIMSIFPSEYVTG
ncbi:uncharacterized protein LOC117638928 [Thrips palmi]|uniref:Uncharacterized protein LOC117638928 n=1 Tax=Thrips palmi TaxID=161013 RepID=A0A6P8Y8K2_THRPL|nr:uncharacterized protein LOC117638928 [Thrips palmi]